MSSFLSGLGIGVELGMVFAPEPGNETRKKLKQRFAAAAKELSQSSRSPRGATRDRIGQLASIRKQQETDNTSDPVAEVLNTASKTKLKSVRGIGESTAKRIIENRPYDEPNAVVEKHILSGAVLKKVEKDLVEEEKG